MIELHSKDGAQERVFTVLLALCNIHIAVWIFHLLYPNQATAFGLVDLIGTGLEAHLIDIQPD